MDMEQSLRDNLEKLVQLQAQQLNAINTIASNTTRANVAGVGNQLPNPQYMSDYVNYSPDYMPPMFPFSPGTQAARQQFRGSVAQLNTPNAGFIDTVFADRSRMSQPQIDMARTSYGSRVGEATIAGAKFGTSAIGSIGAMAVAPGLGLGTLGGIGMGIAGGAVVGGFFDIGLRQSQQHSSINQFLMRESYRFINPNESTNRRDIAGFDQSQRWEAARFLRHFDVEKNISDKETMSLLGKFTEGGLLKDVKDLETFQSKMSKLTDYVKKSALILNKSYEEIAELMSDMNKAGITTQNFDYLASRSRVIGAYTGRSADDIMQTSFGIGQQLSQGTTLSPSGTNQLAKDTILFMSGMYDKSKTLQGADPRQREIFNYIANVGGVDQASAMTSNYMLQFFQKKDIAPLGINFFDWDKDKGFILNQEEFNKFVTSESTMGDLTNKAQLKLNTLGDSNPAAMNEWVQRGGTIMGDLNPANMNRAFKTIIDSAKRGAGNPAIANADLSSQQILSIMFGDNSEMGMLMGNYLDYFEADGGKLLRNAASLTRQQDMLASINANRVGAWGKVVNVGRGISNRIGDMFAPITETAVGAFTGISDWLTGTQYEKADIGRGRSFSAEARETGRELYKNILEGVREGMQELKRQGADISDEMINLFEEKKSEYKVDYDIITGSDYLAADISKNLKSLYSKYEKAGTVPVQNDLGMRGRTREDFRQDIRRTLAGAYDINIDDGINAELSAGQRFAERQTDITTMMREYSVSDNKDLTKWGKMDIYEKSNLLVELHYLKTAMDSNYSGQMSTWQYFTDEERLEASRIQKQGRFFGGKLTMLGPDKGSRDENVDIFKVSEYSESPGVSRNRFRGTIGDMEEAAKKARQEREKLMRKSGKKLGELYNEIKSDSSLTLNQKSELEKLTAAAMTGSSGAVEDLQAFWDKIYPDISGLPAEADAVHRKSNVFKGILTHATNLSKSTMYDSVELFGEYVEATQGRIKLMAGVGGQMLRELGLGDKASDVEAFYDVEKLKKKETNLDRILSSQEKIVVDGLRDLMLRKDDDIEKTQRKQAAFFGKIIGPDEQRIDAYIAQMTRASMGENSKEQNKMLMGIVRDVLTTVDAPGSTGKDLTNEWGNLQETIKGVIASMNALQEGLEGRVGKLEDKGAGTKEGSPVKTGKNTDSLLYKGYEFIKNYSAYVAKP